MEAVKVQNWVAEPQEKQWRTLMKSIETNVSNGIHIVKAI
jgi:hypothetical protein